MWMLRARGVKVPGSINPFVGKAGSKHPLIPFLSVLGWRWCRACQITICFLEKERPVKGNAKTERVVVPFRLEDGSRNWCNEFSPSAKLMRLFPLFFFILLFILESSCTILLPRTEPSLRSKQFLTFISLASILCDACFSCSDIHSIFLVPRFFKLVEPPIHESARLMWSSNHNLLIQKGSNALPVAHSFHAPFCNMMRRKQIETLHRDFSRLKIRRSASATRDQRWPSLTASFSQAIFLHEDSQKSLPHVSGRPSTGLFSPEKKRRRGGEERVCSLVSDHFLGTECRHEKDWAESGRRDDKKG